MQKKFIKKHEQIKKMYKQPRSTSRVFAMITRFGSGSLGSFTFFVNQQLGEMRFSPRIAGVNWGPQFVGVAVEGQPVQELRSWGDMLMLWTLYTDALCWYIDMRIYTYFRKQKSLPPLFLCLSSPWANLLDSFWCLEANTFPLQWRRKGAPK